VDIEPRLKDFSVQAASITEIIAEDGQSLPVGKKQEYGDYWSRSNNCSMNFDYMAPTITNLPKGTNKIKKMTIEVPFKFVLASTEVKIEDILKAKGFSQTVQDLKITVRDVRKSDVTNALEVDLGMEGKVSGISSQMSNIAVVNSQGKNLSEGVINRVSNSNKKAELTISFWNLDKSELENPLSFSFSLPSDTMTRNIQFTFTDVVIP
jgi:hypothetical protein